MVKKKKNLLYVINMISIIGWSGLKTNALWNPEGYWYCYCEKCVYPSKLSSRVYLIDCLEYMWSQSEPFNRIGGNRKDRISR